MATKLEKPVRRVPAFSGPNRRQYVVEISPPDLITFRDLRTRKRYTITLRACYEAAIRADVAATLRLKKKARAR